MTISVPKPEKSEANRQTCAPNLASVPTRISKRNDYSHLLRGSNSFSGCPIVWTPEFTHMNQDAIHDLIKSLDAMTSEYYGLRMPRMFEAMMSMYTS